MLWSSKRNFNSVQIGDTVQVQVPDVDHGRINAGNMLAVVSGIVDFYKLSNKNGTFKQLYAISS